MIIALDIGSKIGYYEEGSKKAYTYDLGKGDERFKKFNDILEGIPKTYKVIYEEAAFQQGHAIPIYHGLVGILKANLIRRNIEYQGIPVGTIKKCFTGKGNANKAAMMAKCDELGMEYDDDNGSDAYATYYTYKELNK